MTIEERKELKEEYQKAIDNYKIEIKLLESLVDKLSKPKPTVNKSSLIRADFVLSRIDKMKELVHIHPYHLNKATVLYFLETLEDIIIEKCEKEKNENGTE